MYLVTFQHCWMFKLGSPLCWLCDRWIRWGASWCRRKQPGRTWSVTRRAWRDRYWPLTSHNALKWKTMHRYVHITPWCHLNVCVNLLKSALRDVIASLNDLHCLHLCSLVLFFPAFSGTALYFLAHVCPHVLACKQTKQEWHSLKHSFIALLLVEKMPLGHLMPN